VLYFLGAVSETPSGFVQQNKTTSILAAFCTPGKVSNAASSVSPVGIALVVKNRSVLRMLDGRRRELATCSFSCLCIICSVPRGDSVQATARGAGGHCIMPPRGRCVVLTQEPPHPAIAKKITRRPRLPLPMRSGVMPGTLVQKGCVCLAPMGRRKRLQGFRRDPLRDKIREVGRGLSLADTQTGRYGRLYSRRRLCARILTPTHDCSSRSLLHELHRQLIS
jgi:hypothetical protein